MGRILVIDDDSVTLEVLPTLLRGRLPDMMIDTASNAQDALAAVQQWRYDIIFIDVHMPGMDGLTFLRRLRTDAQDSRILVFTGGVNESLEADASEAADHCQGASCPSAHSMTTSRKVSESHRLHGCGKPSVVHVG